MFPIRSGGADPWSNAPPTAGLDANQVRHLEIRYGQGVRDLDVLADELQVDPEDIRPHLERLNSSEQQSSQEQFSLPNPVNDGGTQPTFEGPRAPHFDLDREMYYPHLEPREQFQTVPNNYYRNHVRDTPTTVPEASSSPGANKYYRDRVGDTDERITSPGGTIYEKHKRLRLNNGEWAAGSINAEGKRDGKRFLLSTRKKGYELPEQGEKLSADSKQGISQLLDEETGLISHITEASKALGKALNYLSNHKRRMRPSEISGPAAESSAVPATAPPAKRLKRESTAPPLVVPSFGPAGYAPQQLDQSRTEFRMQIGEFCDLTGDQTQWKPIFDANHAVIIVHHPMEPDPRMDDEFPLRNSTDPVNRVDPHYADANGRVHPKVQLRTVQSGLNVNQFTSRVNSALQQSGSRRMNRNEINAAISGVVADVHSEMTRLIENSKAAGGRAPDPPPRRIEPRRLGPNDVEEHESMLVGQYGLIALEPSNPEDVPVPTLRNGRILGIFMGGVVRGETEEEQVAATHPGYQRYLQDAASSRGTGNKVTTYSADGSANSTGFANTALLPPGRSAGPAFDMARINALFLPFETRMKDRNGKDRTEVIPVLVGLDNLFGPNNPGRHVLPSYGDEFLPQLAAPSARAQRAQGRTRPTGPAPIKSEDVETGLRAESSPAAAGQVGRIRAGSAARLPAAPSPTNVQPNQWAQNNEYDDFAHYVVETALRPLVNDGTLHPQNISALRARLDQRVAENAGMREDHAIQEALRTYWQNAGPNEKNIYDRMLRVATGTQGG